MKKLTYLLGVMFLISCFVSNAQAAKDAPIPENQALKDDATKAMMRKQQTDRMHKSHAVNSPSTTAVNPLDENDEYMGRKAEFLGNLTVSELPADFPKYDKSYGLKYYNNLVDNFYGAHKDILKPKVRTKIEYSYPSNNSQPQNSK